jgi:hypothetical protein
MKKQPLTAVTLLFVLGTVVADRASLDWRWPMALSCGALLIALSSQRARNYALPLLLVTAGAANLSFRTAILSPRDIRTVATGVPAIATIRGHLTETPFQRVYERGQRESWRTIAFISLESVSFAGHTNQPAPGALAISTSGILASQYYEGQDVEITGVMQVPAGPIAEGMFDYRKYLDRLGIYYQLQVSSTNDWLRVGPPQSPTFSDRFLTWGQSALALGQPEIDEPLRLLWAMTLGWKTALNGEVSEPFMRSGTIDKIAFD